MRDFTGAIGGYVCDDFTAVHPLCGVCRRQQASRLCDGRSGRGTCDARLCADCTRRPQGTREDYCPTHAEATP